MPVGRLKKDLPLSGLLVTASTFGGKSDAVNDDSATSFNSW